MTVTRIGLPCGQVGGRPSNFIDLIGDPIAEGMLEVVRLLVGLRPAETNDLGQQPFRQGMAPERPFAASRPRSVS